MPASLPVPDDADPNDTDDARQSAPVRSTPSKPPRKRAPRKKPVVDPGPPPPLPEDLLAGNAPADGARADIVIPLRPPLPSAAEIVEPETGPEPDHESEPTAPEINAPAKPKPKPKPRPRPKPQPMPEPVVHAVAVLDSVLEADTDTPALRVHGVCKRFGSTLAVDSIDLTIPAGSFFGLVGPNGAGKTTTLSMIAGLLRPDSGSISVNGVDAATDPLGAKWQMGVLPDRLRTFDRLTGRQLLHYYGMLRGLTSAVVRSRTDELARAFDLSDALGRVVSDYSAGMVKKVMLAGALIHSPRLLVLDEPFEAVDPLSSAIILDILSTYVSHGGTVILSSHGMELIERVCSRVAVIVAGQVLAQGTVEEVRGELTLEQRFLELAGGHGDGEGLKWLHTFSD